MNLKRFSTFLMAGTVLCTGGLFTSCDDDDPVDPLVGTYAFSGATMVAEVNVVLPQFTTIGTIAEGDQSTTTFIIGQGLYANSPCANPANARTELRTDGTLFNVCAGGETAEAQQGTWEINSTRDELTLNVTVAGQELSVILTNLVDNGLTLSGRINNFPLAKDLNYELGSQLTEGPYSGETNFQIIVVDVVFTRTTL